MLLTTTLKAQYCSPTFTSNIEPITYVEINTISNTTVNTCNTGLALENFTAQSTNLVQGQSYTIYVRGNTCGNYTAYFRVYFDWNQNNSLADAGESFNIGTITNSDGLTTPTISATITVPVTATLGATRMRVMKRYNGYSTGPCQTGAGYGQGEDYTVNIVPPTPLPTFSNFSSVAGVQTMFNACRANTQTPTFTLSYPSTADRVQIELNTKSDFTGTAYSQTFTGVYAASTLYDYVCNSLSPALPATDAAYFVRARGSNDGGSTWSAWTSGIWAYSKGTYINPNEPMGWHYTSKPQFDLGTLLTYNYDNFLVANDNSTVNVAADDFLQLGLGSSDNLLAAAGDQALTEGTSFYSGASNNCITVGYYNVTSVQDWHGFRFQAARIPQGASILSANFSCYAHTGSGCGGSSNTTNQMLMKLRSADFDNCAAWANSTNVSTGAPRYRTRTAPGVDWDIPSGASQQWSTGLLLNAPDITSIIQPVVSRAGYAAGNAIGVIIDHDAAAGNYWRYFATMSASFDNFYNDIQFPSVSLASFDGATAFTELFFDIGSTCPSCEVTFDVRNAANNATLLSTPFATNPTSPITLASSAANVYVIARIKRSGGNSPTINSVTLRANNPNIVLPIKLKTFTGKEFKGDNLLKWETLTEQNNDYFVVEKSDDAINFYEIGRIKGAGNSNVELNYQYVDNKITNDIHYYRLRQVDYNGDFSNSSIISINRNFKAEANIYPNPAKDLLFIEIKANADEMYNVQYVNILGKLTKESLFVAKGSNIYSTKEFKNLAGGVYVVQLLNEKNEVVRQQKIIKE
ncbi:MAG TPA: T9SS type A sorting domain-containing protein [Vicingus sp.]|nr:T9SS type A sorting domain-containing protein [Vicingus sp.]